MPRRARVLPSHAMLLRQEGAVRVAVGLLLFVSGATGLTYEVIWSRALTEVIGNSGEANAIVLATFMGGLALGAYFIGRWADGTARPLQLYGYLEMGVGACALFFPVALEGASRLYLALAPTLPSWGRLVARTLLS